MPILDQGYQHWNGRLGARAPRWWAITRQGVKVQLKNRWVVMTLVGALIPALGLVAFLALWGLFEQKSAILTPLLFLFQNLPEELRAGPKGYRSAVWTISFSTFLEFQIFASMMLTLLVGPDLISQDLRFNALPLYFSKPLRRVDYFIGKLGIIAAFLLAVTLAPAVLAYVVGLGFSLDPATLRDTWRVLAASTAFSLIVAASAGLLMLAFSSLSRNSRHVTALWVGLWMVGNVASGAMMATPQRAWAPLLSYTSNLGNVRDALFGVDAEWEKLSRLFRAGREIAQSNAPPFGPFRRRAVQSSFDEDQPSSNPFSLSKPSWPWAAGVLAGLGAVSVVILSTRVRSLDRLK